ncbi:MAG: hypothetical protein RIR62_1097 [Pseudomonadota bacterium]
MHDIQRSAADKARVTVPPAKAPRDPRLDVFRGLCLVMIFINHVPKNVFEQFTSRNFGFSDAAEGFVMMSGIAAGLAYSADFRLRERFVTGLTRVWKRVWTIYLAHLLTTAGALALAAGAVLWLGDAQILFQNNFEYLFLQPLETLVALPLLLHQFGYINILPLYLVLLFFAPFALFAAWRWPMRLWAGAVLLWFVAGIFRWGLPNWPMEGNWFFNPVTWQVIFVTGLLVGVAMKDGRRLVPVLPWLQWLTGGFLAFSLLATQVPEVSRAMGHTLWLVKEYTGAPWNLTSFDKPFVTAPRLLHILALTYFLSTLPVVRRACAHRLAAPLELLGRHALPVFVLGSMMCIGLQAVRHTLPHTVAMDAALIGGGLALQFALAAARQYWPKPARG